MKEIGKALAAAAVAGAMLGAVAPTQAADNRPWMGGRLDYGFYLGGNVGYSHAEVSDPQLPAGFAYTSTDKDESDVGAKVFAGYRFNRNFALEAGYAHLGKFGHSGTTTPAATTRLDLKVTGWNVDLVGILPLQNNFSLFGRVGAFFSQTRLTSETSGFLAATRPNAKARETNLKLGVGVQYDFTPALGVRAEWDHYADVGKPESTSEGDVNLVSVGLIYRFR